MEIDYVGVGILISVAINFALMYNRKKKWNSNLFRWGFTGVVCIIGILGMLFGPDNEDFHFFSWCLMTPIIHSGVDRFFKALSKNTYNRDFYLALRYSDDISLFGKNKHLKVFDKVVSILLVIIAGILPLAIRFSF